jgi:hypothetical protein
VCWLMVHFEAGSAPDLYNPSSQVHVHVEHINLSCCLFLDMLSVPANRADEREALLPGSRMARLGSLVSNPTAAPVFLGGFKGKPKARHVDLGRLGRWQHWRKEHKPSQCVFCCIIAESGPIPRLFGDMPRTGRTTTTPNDAAWLSVIRS